MTLSAAGADLNVAPNRYLMGQYLSLPGNMRPDLVSFDSVLIELVLNISLRTPFDCQHQISGWELLFHRLDEAIRVLGLFELFLID